MNRAVLGNDHTRVTESADDPKVIFWHRDLPPLDAEPMSEHTVEASSKRVNGSLAYRDQLWKRCYDDLMTRVRERLLQEVDRLGGDFAHVLGESIDSRHDPVTSEAWLHGRFSYLLLRRP
jgi:hypothetical protein